MLDKAQVLNDLRIPPVNRLENLKDNKKGQQSIRIKGPLPICFAWTGNAPSTVELVDTINEDGNG